jgi:hypothetical protein
VLSQSVQNLLNMFQVFHPNISKDGDFIQIHHHKRIGERPQDIIHHPHEILWGIRQTKGHEQPFKNTFFGLEGSLPYIGLVYWDLVVATIQINITGVFFPLEMTKEIFNLGNWVSVPDNDFIYGPVINAESRRPIFLLHKHDWASTR